MSGNDMRAFISWLGADPRNPNAYDALLSIWKLCLDAGAATEIQEMRAKAMKSLFREPRSPADRE